MSNQILSPDLPKLSTFCLVVLYALVLPWSLLGALLLTTGSENDLALSLAHEQPGETISAQELASHLRPPGTHVSLSDYSLVISMKLGSGGHNLQTQDVEVKPAAVSESDPQSSLIYATLSEDTAANVVNSGDIVIPGGPLLPKNISLPPLDAVVVSSDEHYVRIIDTSIAQSYRTIMIHRVLAGLVLVGGIITIFAIVKIHRHRRLGKPGALVA